MAQVLDAVCDIISSVGESGLLALDNSHPLEADAQRVLTRVSRRIQSRGWFFNRRCVTLTQDVDGKVPVPSTYLSVDPADRNLPFVQRSGFLFDMQNNTDVLDRDVECVVIDYLEFTNLPETVAAYIQAEACMQFFKNYDGDGTKLRALIEDARLARIPFHAEHIRNSDVNLFASGSTGHNLAEVRGYRYQVRNG